MRKLKSFALAALALVVASVTGSALADIDELGLTPKHWYKYNGNMNSSGETAVSIGGENGGAYFDGVSDKAMKIVDGNTHPWGSGVQYGNGAWSIVTVAKAAFSGSNATIFWATGVKGDWFGLLATDVNTVKVAQGNGGGITESEPLTATVDDATAYHVYVIVYDGNGGLSLFVDGELGASKTGYTPKTNGNFQWGAVNQGVPSGISRVTNTGLDDWRLYQLALTAEQVKTITGTFIFDTYETTITQETVKVSDINNATDFSGYGDDVAVSVNLVGTKTLLFDDDLRFIKAMILLDGALNCPETTGPNDLRKFDFSGVTGGVVYNWLELGSGIAVNFHKNSGTIAANADSAIPRLLLKGSCWNNTEGANGTVDAVVFAPGGETLLAGTTTKVTWSSATTYQGTGASGFLNGYIDDGNPSPTIRIDANVPFDRYDVLIFATTDMSNCKFRPFKVNGLWYTWSDAEGKTVIGTQSQDWGMSRQTAPIYGKNILRVTNQTSPALTIEALPRNGGVSRGCIAAIVIVKTHEVREYEFADPVDYKWNNLDNWWIGETPATELPTVYDTVAFPSSRKGYEVVLPGDVAVKAITMQAALASFTGGSITLADKGYGSTIMGTATLVFDGGLPDESVKDDLQSADWKGTVWLKNATGLANINFTKYGNANTTVKCTDISGYFAPNTEFAGTLELENGETGYALNIHDGSSNDGKVVTFDRLTGSGKILGDGGSTAGFLVKDWTDFTGDVVLTNKTVTFGDTKKADVNKIIVNPDFAYTLVGQTWTANGGIQIDGTIGGKGALVGTASFGLNATLDASGTELLTVNALPIFAETNKFVVASAPADGVPVKVLATAEGVTLVAKTYDTVPVIIVGGAEVDCKCQVKAAEDGIYLEKVSGKFDLVLDDATVTASALNQAELANADGASIVTITLTGEDPTIVLDEPINGGDIKIVHEGTLTISAVAEPPDFGKYDLRGITGFIRYSWLAMKRVVNLNFRDGGGSRGFNADDMTFDGLLAGNTPKASWINLGDDASNDGVVITNAWHASDFEAVEIEGMTVGWKAKTVYQANQDIPVLTGYLDDGDIGTWPDGVTITLKDVPFEAYDIIVYYNTDMADRVYPPVKVNGVAYTWDGAAGKTVFGTANWGETTRNGVAYGKNALRISNLSGDVKITTAPRDNTQNLRGCVPAIQIVEVEKKANSFVADTDTDVLISELNKIVPEGYTDAFTVTLNGGKLIYDTEFVCGALFVNSRAAVTITTGGEEISAEELAKVNLAKVDGEVTFEIPRVPLATSSNGAVYTVGVGTEAGPVSLVYPVENGLMTIRDGVFHLDATAGGATSTVSFVDATIFATNGQGLAVGMANFTLSGATTVTAKKVILSEGDEDRVASLTLNDTAKIVVTGETIADQNTSSIMFGHYDGPSTFTMNGNAEFLATNAQVLVGKTSNNHEINLNGGTFVAKGIKASSSANLTNTLNLAGTTLYLGEYGISSYSENATIDVNVLDDTTIYATDPTIAITQPIAIADGKTLTIDAGTNTIDFVAGVNRDLRAFELGGVTNVVITETMEEYLVGSVLVRGIPAEVTVVMERADWTKPSVVLSDGEEDGERIFRDDTSRVSGPACWMDFTFTKETLELRQGNQGTIENAGSAGKNLGLTYDTNFNAANSYNTENGSLLGKATPYRHMTGNAEWPEKYTVAVYANVPNVNKGCIVAFGSSQGGEYGTSYVAIVRGATADEILLVRGTAHNVQAETLATMAADNATAAKHLVVFTNDGEKFTVYCDGMKINETAAFELGKGFQVGSVHGGIGGTGVARVNDIQDAAIKEACEIKSIRVFDRIITSEEMDLLCEEFPYIPQGGLYLRDFESGTNYLQSAAAWHDSEATEQTTDLPTAKTIDDISYKPSIRVETDAEATLILNASLAAEKITFNGLKKLTITADGSANTLKATSAVAVNCPLAIAYGEVDINASPLKIGENGSIEIDVAPLNIDIATIFKETFYQLTGLTDEAPGKITVKNAPYGDVDRTVELVFENSQYWLRIGPSRPAGEIALVPGVEGISNGTAFTDENGEMTQRFYRDDVIVIKDRFEALGIEAELEVPVGDFRVAEYGYLGFAGWSAHGAVTVDAGGVFDMKGVNGQNGPFYKLVLNGGSYVNTVAPEGVNDTLDNKTYPVTSVELTADSFLGATNTFGLVGQGYAATTVDFGEMNVLTKVGEAPVIFRTTTFSGTGTLKVEEGAVDLRGCTIKSNAWVTVAVSADGALTLANQFNKSEFGRFDIACDGFLTVSVNATVDNLTGSGSTSGDGQLTISGIADYAVTPVTAFLDDGATIRLGTGRNVLKDEPLSCLGSVTFDAVDGAKLRGKGTIAYVTGEPVFTDAFVEALKASDRKVEVVKDDDGGSVVEIKAIPRFLLMLK